MALTYPAIPLGSGCSFHPRSSVSGSHVQPKDDISHSIQSESSKDVLEHFGKGGYLTCCPRTRKKPGGDPSQVQ